MDFNSYMDQMPAIESIKARIRNPDNILNRNLMVRFSQMKKAL